MFDEVPRDYVQGIFAELNSYNALVRISTGAGDILHDSVSLLRGFAIKLIGIEGERLEGTEGDRTHDFLFANGIRKPFWIFIASSNLCCEEPVRSRCSPHTLSL